MGLLTNVLLEAEQANLRELHDKCTALTPRMKEFSDKIEGLSSDLNIYFVENYVDFNSTKCLGQLNFINRLAKLEDECKIITDEVAQIESIGMQELDSDFVKNCDDLREKIKSWTFHAALANCVLNINQATTQYHRQNYCEAVTLFNQAFLDLNQLKSNNLKCAIREIKNIYHSNYAVFIADVVQQWSETFSWSSFEVKDYYSYSLHVGQSDIPKLNNIIKTLHIAKKLPVVLLGFSDFFMDNMTNTLLNNNCDILTDENMKTITFTIKVMKSEKKPPSFQTVIENISALFEFLNSTLNVKNEHNVNIMISTFSKLIRGRFFKAFKSQCLHKSMNNEESTKFKSELNSFNSLLIDVDFISEEESPLKTFLQSAEAEFNKQASEDSLMKIKALFSSNIFKSCNNVCLNFEAFDELTIRDSFNVKCASANLLLKKLGLQNCPVSSNVKEAMTTLTNQIYESNNKDKENWLFAGDNVLKTSVLYQTLIPHLQGNDIQSSYDVAIYFNTSFYMAHCLLGPPWRNVLNPEYANYLTLIAASCIQDLRSAGLEALAKHLTDTKKVIAELICPNEPLNLTYEGYEKLKANLRSALLKVKLLQQAWYGVLPKQIFEVTMSTLISGFCQGFLQKVFHLRTAFPDELAVDMLATLLCDIEGNISEVFKDLDLTMLVKQWSKLKHLAQLISAPAHEIVGSWQNKSETMKAYTAEEVRHIFALRFGSHKRDLMTKIQ